MIRKELTFPGRPLSVLSGIVPGNLLMSPFSSLYLPCRCGNQGRDIIDGSSANIKEGGACCGAAAFNCSSSWFQEEPSGRWKCILLLRVITCTTRDHYNGLLRSAVWWEVINIIIRDVTIFLAPPFSVSFPMAGSCRRYWLRMFKLMFSFGLVTNDISYSEGINNWILGFDEKDHSGRVYSLKSINEATLWESHEDDNSLKVWEIKSGYQKRVRTFAIVI